MTRLNGRAHLYAFLAVLAGCAFLVLRMTAPYLLALFLGGMLAMLGHPFAARLERRGCRPRVAAWSTTVLMTLLLVGPLAAFSTMAVREGVAAGRTLRKDPRLTPDGVEQALAKSPRMRGLLGDRDTYKERLEDWYRRGGEAAAALALKVTATIPLLMLQLLLALVSCYFFLIDGARLARRLLGLTALDRDVQEALISSFRDTAVSSVLAGLAAAAAQAAVVASGFAALGVPRPFLAGAATFLLAWVPAVGSVPASLAGVAYLWFEGTPGRVAAMIAVGVVAGVIDNLIRPVVLKGRDEMHPLVGLVAVIGGIDMFGILGLFLGPILAATFVELLDLWPQIGGRYGLDLEEGA